MVIIDGIFDRDIQLIPKEVLSAPGKFGKNPLVENSNNTKTGEEGRHHGSSGRTSNREDNLAQLILMLTKNFVVILVRGAMGESVEHLKIYVQQWKEEKIQEVNYASRDDQSQEKPFCFGSLTPF